MAYTTLVIADDGAVSSRRKPTKSRAFRATLLTAVVWPKRLQHDKHYRPIFLDFCGTESEHRAFVANLRCGHVAGYDLTHRLEIMKSEAYRYAPLQRVELEAGPAVRQVVYLPDLFDVEVKSQSEEIWLCALPPRLLLATVTTEERAAAKQALALWNRRIDAERLLVDAENKKREEYAEEYYRTPWRVTVEKQMPGPLSQLRLPDHLDLDDDAVDYWALASREVCVRLDARTRYPVPSDAEFRVLLLQCLLQRGYGTLTAAHPLRSLLGSDPGWRNHLNVMGDECGYLAPLAINIKQDDLGKLIRELAAAFFGEGS
jgi:hypothetical protein